MVVDLGEMLEVPPAVRDTVCLEVPPPTAAEWWMGGLLVGFGFRTMLASFGMVRA